MGVYLKGALFKGGLIQGFTLFLKTFVDVSEEAKESSTASRSERRRQKKPQNAQRIPRSVSEEVLALEGKFQPQYEQEASVLAAQPSKRSRRARRRGT